jgi:DNA phosphorothioation-dependent restriction protein DptH
MSWNELHATLLSAALEQLLRRGENGAVAFIRCLPHGVVKAAAGDAHFAPQGWKVYRVADAADLACQTITADQAVELREEKGPAMLLLVDTERAGAGMDGVYSAAREIGEKELFDQALRIAYQELEKRVSPECRREAEEVIKKARGWRGQKALAPWVMFDFLVQVMIQRRYLGELIYLVGLWPVAEDGGRPLHDFLHISQALVDELLRAGQQSDVNERLKMIGIEATPEQLAALQQFLHKSGSKPLLEALATLDENYPSLRINELKLIDRGTEVHSLELVPWRNPRGQILKWSGLTEDPDVPDGLPVLMIPPEGSEQSVGPLEVRWRVKPSLEKDQVRYRVTICTDLGDELAVREISHTGPREQKCRFRADELGLENDTVVTAHVKVEVIDQSDKHDESEPFEIRFGEPADRGPSQAGKRVRAFSEGVISLQEEEDVLNFLQERQGGLTSRDGSVTLRLPGSKPTLYRVPYPALIYQTDQTWKDQEMPLGRWRLKIRGDGIWVERPEFVPFTLPEAASDDLRVLWERTVKASRELARHFAQFGGVGTIYHHEGKFFDTVVKEYLLAWERLLSHPEADPQWAITQTVEVQTLTGKLVGLIVLPGHPLRVAWHAAYDNLAFHTKFAEEVSAKSVVDELKLLDGAMFPAFLPGLEAASTFVFADTLGFHAVAMVSDHVKEPKAAVALLAQALDNGKNTESAPTVGQQSAEIIGEEILKYLESHDAAQLLRLHALQAGDGRTIAKALKRVFDRSQRKDNNGEIAEQDEPESSLRFVMELYPSESQRALAGAFLSRTRETRRKGAGTLSAEDRWMLESVSLPGQLVRPRLRWARKEGRPATPAHLAIAFDVFESKVKTESDVESRPITAYSLMNFFVRQFKSRPFPHWISSVPDFSGGQKHPADRLLTDRLLNLLKAMHSCAARHLGSSNEHVVLQTEVSPEHDENLRQLHKQCDWVITLDRHAGIEYFDSPRDNPLIYDAYIIDCVPEREDLGCLQMITSTSNLLEVRRLLDEVLSLMGLSSSRRNAEFLLKNLKALSGRLAIRLTGHKPPAAELVALALSYNYCRVALPNDKCWLSLRNGFFVPVDDVSDLLPPLRNNLTQEEGYGQTQEGGEDHSTRGRPGSRPDLIYISYIPRKGLSFQFVEVKYRRDLASVRRVELLDQVQKQVTCLRDRWADYYGREEHAPVLALRRAKLARVLRFYADKARRHADDAEGAGLSEDAYRELLVQIDRMVERASEYNINVEDVSHRGWIFCPEFQRGEPEHLVSADAVEIYVFGPARLPDVSVPLGDVRTNEGPSKTLTEEKPSPNGTQSDQGAPSPTSVGPTGGSKKSVPTDVKVILGRRRGTEEEVAWHPTIRSNPHMMIVGLPGMGKTNVLVNICAQLHRQGITPIIFSYHADLEERLESIGCRLHMVDYDRLGINPLNVLNRDNPKAYLDVAGAVRDIFLAIFPDLGDVQGGDIREAIVKSYEEKGWKSEDPSAQPEVPSFGRFFEILQKTRKPGQGFENLLGRLKELSDYKFFDTGTSMIDIWTADQPIAVRLHRTQNDTLQRAMAMLIFYDLYKGMFRRGTQDRITHVVVFDEAHRASRLRLLPTMAKECRKYGISLVVASQEARDFDTSLFSAIANYLVLRVNAQDAKALAHNTSTSDQEKQLIDKMKQLPKYHAIYMAEGSPRPVDMVLDEAKPSTSSQL